MYRSDFARSSTDFYPVFVAYLTGGFPRGTLRMQAPVCLHLCRQGASIAKKERTSSAAKRNFPLHPRLIHSSVWKSLRPDDYRILQVSRALIQPLRCLKNSTCRNRFSASAFVLYGPPRFFPFSDRTLYPSFTFLITIGLRDMPQPFDYPATRSAAPVREITPRIAAAKVPKYYFRRKST